MSGSRITRRGLLGGAGTAALVGGGHAAASGFDATALARVRAKAAELDQLNALIVARGGRIALAEAFRGPALDRPVNVKSVSKTIVATLVGCALDRGILESVDQPVAPLLADRVPAGADPRVHRITLAHLLTMQAGLERTSGANYGAWVQSRDWIADALGRPFVTDPGARMLYSTGSYHLLGAALARAADRNLLALARDWLGRPLGIEVPAWTRDPQGFYLGGNNMALSPLALLGFGELWQNRGLVGEARVLSEAWIAASWQPRTRSPWSGDLYGYGWFLTRTGAHDVAYARGYGGQMLYVIPSLALVVVMTSDPTRPARSDGHVGALDALLARDIVPAAQNA